MYAKRALFSKAELTWILFLGLVLVARSAVAQPPAAPVTAAASFQVVVNADNPTETLSRSELAMIFLKKGAGPGWNGGSSPAPVDLTADFAVRDAFSRTVLLMETREVMKYWQGEIFNQRNVPPPEVRSLQAVFDYVLRQPGGVAYVPADAPLPTGVKVLRVAAD